MKIKRNYSIIRFLPGRRVVYGYQSASSWSRNNSTKNTVQLIVQQHVRRSTRQPAVICPANVSGVKAVG